MSYFVPCVNAKLASKSKCKIKPPFAATVCRALQKPSPSSGKVWLDRFLGLLGCSLFFLYFSVAEQGLAVLDGQKSEASLAQRAGIKDVKRLFVSVVGGDRVGDGLVRVSVEQNVRPDASGTAYRKAESAFDRIFVSVRHKYFESADKFNALVGDLGAVVVKERRPRVAVSRDRQKRAAKRNAALYIPRAVSEKDRLARNLAAFFESFKYYFCFVARPVLENSNINAKKF